MATITITVPDAVMTRVTEALCATTGRPVSGANAKAAVQDYIKDTVRSYERREAVTTAVAQSDASPPINLT